MRRFSFLALICCLGAIDSARGQGPMWRPGPAGGSFGQGIGQNPAVSPYLNLYRRGSSVAVNYYGLVRPAIEFQGAIQNLQQQVDMAAPGTGSGGFDSSNPLLTGSRARYMNTGNYFLSGVPMTSRQGGNSGSIVLFNPQPTTMSGGQFMQMGGSVPNVVNPPRR